MQQSGEPVGAGAPNARAAEVRVYLKRILASETFAGARRLSAFLSFVVESTMEAKEVKEVLIGVEVYGRDPAYNPKTDSIVRAEASRLRAKLREYYEGPGTHDEIVIDLPKGSYVPAFHARRSEELAPLSLPPKPMDRRKGRRLSIIIAAAAVVCLVAGWLLFRRPEPSIALVTLRDVSADKKLGALTGSMTNHLTRALLDSSAWRVVGPSQVLDVTGGNPPLSKLRELQADVVLTGTVNRLGERDVRVTLDAWNATDGYLVWREVSDKSLLRANEVQLVAAQAAIASLTEKYTGRGVGRQRKTYALARELWSGYTPAGLAQSIPYFEEVTRQDPAYAPAWAGLADAFHRLALDSMEIDTSRHTEAARKAAQKALSLDDANAEAHHVLGRIHLYHDWNFRAAAEHLHRAVALDPTRMLPALSLSQALAIRGEMDHALAAIREARARLPLLSDVLMQEGSVFFLARRFERMEEVGRELRQLEPESPSGRWLVGLSLEMRGQVAAAIAEYEAALRNTPREDRRVQCALAHAYGKAGQRNKALETMRRYYPDLAAPLTRFSLSYCVALTYASFGDREQAFVWLDRARQHRDLSFPFFRGDARFDGLKDDPRYQKLAASLQ